MTEVISVITPNFNGERWLPDCLDSIAEQTIDQSRIELIIADDGSTDSSLKLIETYADKIKNLTLLPFEHTGLPGVMRNRALKAAVGKYALFLDSDDYLGVDALSRLDDFANISNSDVIAFQLEGLDRNVPRSMLSKTAIDVDVVESGVYKTLGTWKMCSVDFLKFTNLQFSETDERGEDTLFFAEAMLRASSISVLSGYSFYTIRGREDGSSITQQEWDPYKRIDVAKQMVDLITKYAVDPGVKNHFLIRPFNTDILSIIEKDPNEELREYIKDRLGQYWSKEISHLVYADESRAKLEKFFEDRPA